MTTIPTEITMWCTELAAMFRREEHAYTTTLGGDRDAAIVEYALRTLANARDPITETVLDTIDRRRTVTA